MFCKPLMKYQLCSVHPPFSCATPLPDVKELMPDVCKFMAYEGQDWMSEGKSCTKDKYTTIPQPPLLYYPHHIVKHVPHRAGSQYEHLVII